MDFNFFKGSVGLGSQESYPMFYANNTMDFIRKLASDYFVYELGQLDVLWSPQRREGLSRII